MLSQPLTTVAAAADLRLLDPTAVADWDAQVGRLPGATVFHSAGWARVLCQSYGYTPTYFTLWNSQQSLTAALPLMEVNSWLTGRRGVGLPFSDACEPLYADREAAKTLIDAAAGHGVKHRWKHIEVRGGRSLFPEAPASTTFFTHRLDLSAGPERLLSGFASATRRAIRKAEKSGVTVEFSQDLNALRSFYALLCATRRKHGVPPQPFSFFRAIHEQLLLQGAGQVILAHHSGRPIAGGLFLGFGKAALYKFGASDEAAQHLRPNNLVMAKAVEWYAAHGFTSFDFGRTSVHNQGLREFKCGWGASEHPLEYVRFVPETRAFAAAPDKPEGMVERVFQHLPLGVSRIIGALLYRHVA